MRRSWNTTVLITVVITLTTTILPTFSVNAQNDDEMHASLGVSDINVVGFVNQTETKQFEVARIYNTGDFNMTIQATWIPNSDSDGIEIEIIPKEVYLKPEEAKSIYAKVLGLAVGDYSGKIDFSSDVHLPPNYHGNPSVPGGQANARFIVVEKGFVAPSQPFAIILLIVIVVGVVCVGVLVGVWKYKQR